MAHLSPAVLISAFSLNRASMCAFTSCWPFLLLASTLPRAVYLPAAINMMPMQRRMSWIVLRCATCQEQQPSFVLSDASWGGGGGSCRRARRLLRGLPRTRTSPRAACMNTTRTRMNNVGSSMNNECGLVNATSSGTRADAANRFSPEPRRGQRGGRQIQETPDVPGGQ